MSGVGERRPMRRLWWLLRQALHDWMWEGVEWNFGWQRRLAQRLPLYFSDPDYVRPEEFDRIMAEGEAVELDVRFGSPWERVEANGTWASGNTSTFTWRRP